MMGMYCGMCDARIHVPIYPSDKCEKCNECNLVGCRCDLNKWHINDPIVAGEYITIESSSSSGGDQWVSKRYFKDKNWVGLKETDPYDDIEFVILWIEKGNFEKL
jgi:hypothetical protein